MVLEELDTIEDFTKRVGNNNHYYIQYTPLTFKPYQYAGWKYTIVGSTIDNIIFLYEKLSDLVFNTYGLTFKMGTTRLINSGVSEQQFKLMTIYVDRDLNNDTARLNEFQGALVEGLRDYVVDSHVKLEYSEHLVGSIYTRHDIDEDGMYIPAKPTT